MNFLAVFTPSCILTLIIGVFQWFAWPQTRKPSVLASFWGSALAVHLAWLAIPWLGAFTPVARWLAIFWLASMLAALVLLLPFAILTALGNSRKLKLPALRLPTAYAGCCLAIGIIVSLSSTAPFLVRQEEIRIRDLPAALDGMRIANLGDVHIGQFIDAKELSRGIDAINAQHVDLLVITGDLVDDVSQLESAMQALEQSNSPNKIIAVLGNHEQMRYLPEILGIYGRHKARIALLVNENTTIERGGTRLRLVGVDFPTNPKGGHMRPRPEQNAAMSAQAELAFKGVDAGEPIVALSHHPSFFPFAAAHGAQLTLASHTHGGQLRLFGYALIDAYPYLQGCYRRGNAYLDVSAGFGHWLPIRFGVPREIVIVTLRRESDR